MWTGFFFAGRKRETRLRCDWSCDVCSAKLTANIRRREWNAANSTYQRASRRIQFVSLTPSLGALVRSGGSLADSGGHSEHPAARVECNEQHLSPSQPTGAMRGTRVLAGRSRDIERLACSLWWPQATSGGPRGMRRTSPTRQLSAARPRRIQCTSCLPPPS